MTRACANPACDRNLDEVRPRLRADARYCGRACQRNAFRGRENAAKAAQARGLSQVERVQRALRRGPVSPTDFLLPGVVDGGKPIIRLAARIHDLRKAGHEILERPAPNGTAIYTLQTVDPTSDGSPSTVAPAPQADGALFDPRTFQAPTCGWNHCDRPVTERGLCDIHESMLDDQELEDNQ